MVVLGVCRVPAMVMGCVDLLDNGVETVFVVSGILDHSGRTVGLHETVRSFDVTVTVAHLVLALDVVRVQIFYTVLEMVWFRCVIVMMVGHVTLVRNGWISKGQVPDQSGKHNQLECSTLSLYWVDNITCILVHYCVIIKYNVCKTNSFCYLYTSSV